MYIVIEYFLSQRLGSVTHRCEFLVVIQLGQATMSLHTWSGGKHLKKSQKLVLVQAMEGQALPTLVEGEALPLKEVELHQVTSFHIYIVVLFAVIRIDTRGNQSCYVSCCHYKT